MFALIACGMQRKRNTVNCQLASCQRIELFAWKPEAVRLRPFRFPVESSAHRGRHQKLLLRMLGARLKREDPISRWMNRKSWFGDSAGWWVIGSLGHVIRIDCNRRSSPPSCDVSGRAWRPRILDREQQGWIPNSHPQCPSSGHLMGLIRHMRLGPPGMINNVNWIHISCTKSISQVHWLLSTNAICIFMYKKYECIKNTLLVARTSWDNWMKLPYEKYIILKLKNTFLRNVCGWFLILK